MAKFKKYQTLVYIFIVLALIVINFTTIFVSNASAKMSSNSHCRANNYKVDGKVCYDCYTWDNPPYWGCIFCPWSTC